MVAIFFFECAGVILLNRYKQSDVENAALLRHNPQALYGNNVANVGHFEWRGRRGSDSKIL